MNDHARYTNGDWKLPPHANGVLREEDVRVPPGERGMVRGHIGANGTALTLKNPGRPEDGWTLR